LLVLGGWLVPAALTQAPVNETPVTAELSTTECNTR